MPTYGYECLSCDNQFEIFQSIKDDALTVCTECGGTLRKRIYPVGISFKGSGFYVNDYAPKSSGEGDASSAKPAETAPAASGDGKSEPAKSEPAKSASASPEKTEPKTKTESKTPVPASAPAASSSGTDS